jgi:hypothetical protein
MEFATRQGWSYDVLTPTQQAQLGSTSTRGSGVKGAQPKQYATNFTVKRRGIPIWTAGQSAGE